MGDDFNPYPFMRAAGCGDIAALRTLAGAAAKQGVEQGDLIAFIEALLFSRLAYAASGDLEDAGTTLAILSLASEFCPNESAMLFSWSAEAVALTSLLADLGDAFAEQTLPALVAKCGAEATEAGKDILKMMEGAD
jgi:hypothetical protein